MLLLMLITGRDLHLGEKRGRKKRSKKGTKFQLILIKQFIQMFSTLSLICDKGTPRNMELGFGSG